MVKLQKLNASYIDGSYLVSSQLQPNFYPATNEVINQTAYATEQQIIEAIQSSQHAFKKWSMLSMNQRSDILLSAARLLRQKVKQFAELEVWDTGKPISEALSVDVYSAADCLEYFAKISLAFEDSVMPHTNALIYTIREPLGVCVGIGAWNYPLQIACWKAAPALIMGNTMIYKPSELTPMTTLLLAETFVEAGMPPGVFNVILGDEALAKKLLSQKGIAKVSFTGSIATGKKILHQMADHLIPVTLELGGKSPFIIFDDANLDQAVFGSMLANFYTQGEVCSNGTRVFVAKKSYNAFMDALVHKVKKLIIGDPFNKKTQVGSLISKNHMQKVMGYIDQGKNEGAELVHGGKPISDKPLHLGNFVEPTIFAQCKDNMTIVRDEIFGPVMTVLTFDDEEEVIHRANNTEYGLAAGLFTDNIKRAHRVAKQLQAGVCWVNNYNITPVSMPFGGYKSSGLGRENGIAALSNYSQLKSIYVELKDIEHTYE